MLMFLDRLKVALGVGMVCALFDAPPAALLGIMALALIATLTMKPLAS